MIPSRDLIVLTAAIISLGVSIYVMVSRPEPAAPSADTPGDPAAAERLHQEIAALRNEVRALKSSLGEIAAPAASQDGGAEEIASVAQRLASVEASLSRLQSAYDGISLEESSAERMALFLSEDGARKADEYFEARKFSIAAEGYMAYYNSHPDDPDARNILERARQSYQKAGYTDLAMWVQGEMIDIFPENNHQDLMQLAAMQKTAGNFDEAIRRAAEAAEHTNDPQTRLWDRLYWAWYNQLRDGPSGGLNAYLQVQQEIRDAGFSDHRLNERAQEKIDELRQQLAAGQ